MLFGNWSPGYSDRLTPVIYIIAYAFRDVKLLFFGDALNKTMAVMAIEFYFHSTYFIIATLLHYFILPFLIEIRSVRDSLV